MSECWVATGWCDIGIMCSLAPWDMAAGILIVNEAGGVAKNINSGSQDWNDLREGKVVIGNEEVVDKFIKEKDEVAEMVKNTDYKY